MKDFWYLSSPCTNVDDPADQGMAFSRTYDTTRFASDLAAKGITTYAPIIVEQSIKNYHGHQTTSEEWLEHRKPFIDKAVGLIVYALPDWDKSKNVKLEIEYFEAANKKIIYVTKLCNAAQIRSIIHPHEDNY